MKSYKSLSENHGFTLIEILISLTIGALLLGGIAGFLVSGIQATKTTGQQLEQDNSKKEQDAIITQLQTNGIQNFETITGTGYLVTSNNKNYLIEEKTSTGLCGASQPLNSLEITEILKNDSTQFQTAGVYKIDDSSYQILSGSTAVFGTGIQGKRIVEGNPLYTELGGASAIDLTGSTLAITDPNNHRVFLFSTTGSTIFSTIDTLDFGIEYPIVTTFTTNGLEIIGNTKAITLVDNPAGTFTGYLSKSITNTGSDPLIVTEILTSFSGTNINGAADTTRIICPSGSSPCIDSGDQINTGPSTISYVFTGAGISLAKDETIGIEFQGINLIHLSGSGKEYFGSMKLLSGSTNLLEKPFYFSTVGDGSIATLTGNYFNQSLSGSNLRKTSSGYQSGTLDLNTIKKIETITLKKSPIENLQIIPSLDQEGYILSYTESQNYDCKRGAQVKKQKTIYIKKTD